MFYTEHISWDCVNDETAIEDAQKYINKMCPGAGFNDAGTTLNLLKCYAVSRANDVPVMTISMEMFELSLISAFLNPSGPSGRAAFTDAKAWIRQCTFPKNYGSNLKIIEHRILKYSFFCVTRNSET